MIECGCGDTGCLRLEPTGDACCCWCNALVDRCQHCSKRDTLFRDVEQYVAWVVWNCTSCGVDRCEIRPEFGSDPIDAATARRLGACDDYTWNCHEGPHPRHTVMRPFYYGRQWGQWRARNCDSCVKRSPPRAKVRGCAIDAALCGVVVPAVIGRRMGCLDPEAEPGRLIWRCPEREEET